MLSLAKSTLKTFYSTLFCPDAFECQFNIGKKLVFKVYECPGRWCTDEQLEQIRRDMEIVTVAGQAGKPVPEYGALSGSREDMKSRIISVAYEKETGRPVGFSAQSYLPVYTYERRSQILHLGLIFVDPSMRGQSLTASLSLLPNIVIFLKSGLRPVWISNVSQVPAIIGLVGDNFSSVYPVPNEKVEQTFHHLWYAQQLMSRHRSVFGVGDDAEFDATKQIIRNSYTGGSDHLKKTFAEAPKYRDVTYNQMCERNLDYTRGDDFLQLGRMDLACYLNFMKKKMRGTGGLGLCANFMALALAGLLVPILRWLIPPPIAVIPQQTIRERA